MWCWYFCEFIPFLDFFAQVIFVSVGRLDAVDAVRENRKEEEEEEAGGFQVNKTSLLDY